MSRRRSTVITTLAALTAAAAVALPAASSSAGSTGSSAPRSGAPVPTDAPTTTATTTRPPGTSSTSGSGTPCPTYSLPMRLSPGTVASSTGFEDGTASGWVQPAASQPPAATSQAAYAGAYGLSVSDLVAGPVSRTYGYLNATGAFGLAVWVRLAPGTPDTTVQLRVRAESGKQIAKVKRKLSAKRWVPLSVAYDPGYTHVSYTCNGAVIASWDRSNTVRFELSPVGKKVSAPLGLQLDGVVLTYRGNATTGTTTGHS